MYLPKTLEAINHTNGDEMAKAINIHIEICIVTANDTTNVYSATNPTTVITTPYNRERMPLISIGTP